MTGNVGKTNELQCDTMGVISHSNWWMVSYGSEDPLRVVHCEARDSRRAEPRRVHHCLLHLKRQKNQCSVMDD